MNLKETMSNISLGKLKMWQTRFASYVSMVNFVMLFYLFIVENKWFEWYIWIILISFVTLLIVIFDTFLVMEDQLDYSFKKNPEWRRLMRNQKKIMEKLGIEYEE